MLWWLRNRSRTLTTFVANRVSEIHSASSPQQWHHVPTADNPADLTSRGCSVVELASNQFWLHGPEFLLQDSSEWPTTVIDEQKVAAHDREVKKSAKPAMFRELLVSSGNGRKHQADNVTLMTSVERDAHWRLEPERYSSWVKLKRVYAWVVRFLNNCRSNKEARVQGS